MMSRFPKGTYCRLYNCEMEDFPGRALRASNQIRRLRRERRASQGRIRSLDERQWTLGRREAVRQAQVEGLLRGAGQDRSKEV